MMYYSLVTTVFLLSTHVFMGSYAATDENGDEVLVPGNPATTDISFVCPTTLVRTRRKIETENTTFIYIYIYI